VFNVLRTGTVSVGAGPMTGPYPVVNIGLVVRLSLYGGGGGMYLGFSSRVQPDVVLLPWNRESNISLMVCPLFPGAAPAICVSPSRLCPIALRKPDDTRSLSLGGISPPFASGA